MKKALLLIGLLLVVAAALAGCALNPVAQAVGLTPTAQGSERELPLATEMLVGTFRLEGTAQAIDATQAGTLLPLWKAYRALSTADSAAPAELSALAEQINETLTATQRDAITALALTQGDVSQIAQQQGLDVAPVSNAAQATSGTQQAPAGGPEGGAPGDLGGVPGEGPGGMPGSAAPTGGSASAAGQTGAGNGSSAQGTSALVDALITLLETRAVTA